MTIIQFHTIVSLTIFRYIIKPPNQQKVIQARRRLDKPPGNSRPAVWGTREPGYRKTSWLKPSFCGGVQDLHEANSNAPGLREHENTRRHPSRGHRTRNVWFHISGPLKPSLYLPWLLSIACQTFQVGLRLITIQNAVITILGVWGQITVKESFGLLSIVIVSACGFYFRLFGLQLGLRSRYTDIQPCW